MPVFLENQGTITLDWLAWGREYDVERPQILGVSHRKRLPPVHRKYVFCEIA